MVEKEILFKWFKELCVRLLALFETNVSKYLTILNIKDLGDIYWLYYLIIFAGLRIIVCSFIFEYDAD